MLDKLELDGLRFLFIVQVIQKKAQFSFLGKGKVFIMKLFFGEFNHIFFTAERLACFLLF